MWGDYNSRYRNLVDFFCIYIERTGFDFCTFVLFFSVAEHFLGDQFKIKVQNSTYVEKVATVSLTWKRGKIVKNVDLINVLIVAWNLHGCYQKRNVFEGMWYVLMRIVPILKNAQMSAIIFLRKIKLSSLRKIFPITMVYVSRERTIT